MSKTFTVVVERDSEGWFIASVPTLHGCHTQARSLDELEVQIKDVITLCLQEEGSCNDESHELFSVQQVSVSV